MALFYVGSPEAETVLQDALARAHAARVPLDVPYCTRMLAHVRSQRGAYDEARDLARASVDGFRLFGDRRMEGVARDTLAEILLAAGVSDEAEREAGAAVELLEPDVVFRAVALATRAEALLALDRGRDAAELARTSREMLQRAGRMGLFTAKIERLAARILGALG